MEFPHLNLIPNEKLTILMSIAYVDMAQIRVENTDEIHENKKHCISLWNVLVLQIVRWRSWGKCYED